MTTLTAGEQQTYESPSGATYTLKNEGGVISCTCKAWQFQNAAIERRTCKHLRAVLGDDAETARVGAPATTSTRSASTGGAIKVAPKLLLAHRWDQITDVTGWWMSEKLDGVRAYWDGERFMSRQGNTFYAPEWFTETLGDDPLDGELWVGRKRFQRTVSIVRRQDKSDDWRDVKYLVFDAPQQDAPFEERVEYLRARVAGIDSPYVHVVNNMQCKGLAHLQLELERVEALGGEGLMLREPASVYKVGRSTSLLKVKTFFDAEGRVVDHLPGTGKHKGRLGALRIEVPGGTQFSVGTGFSDDEREAPAAVGTIITFRFQELTNAGVPRFPSYIGARPEWTWDQVTWPPEDVGHDVTPSTVAPVADLVGVTPVSGAIEPVFRQLQFEGSVSDKFWEVAQDGKSLTITSGRIGRKTKVQTKTFPSAKAARDYGHKHADAKLKKGYEEF